MGLAAGQARLLTITGRKSDCEFESMRLSHQKLALARDLADLSNEYQNSLDQTKLVYDFYGTGDTALDLSYGILMTPSALNNYKPTLVTDSMNRVVLNSKYARAAEAAGIPREGFGSLPSEVVRNNFILALADLELDSSGKIVNRTTSLYPDGNPIISEYLATSIVGDLANGIMGVPYNQTAGVGGDVSTTLITRDMSLTELCDYIAASADAADVGNASAVDGTRIKKYALSIYKQGASSYESRTESGDANTIFSYNLDGDRGSQPQLLNITFKNSGGTGTTTSANNLHSGLDYTIGDIIKESLEYNQDIMLTVYGQDNHNNVTGRNGIVDYICNLNLWDQMFEYFESIFNDGSAATELALLTAKETIEKMIHNPSRDRGEYDNFSVGNHSASCSAKGYVNVDGNSLSDVNGDDPDGENDFDNAAHVIASRGSDWYDSTVMNKLDGLVDYVGYVVVENNDNYGSDDDSDMSAGAINVTRVIMAYLTEFYKQMNGTTAGQYNVEVGAMDKNKFIDGSAVFTVVDTEVASDVTSYAGFYDAMFNMMCLNGWCENGNIDDNDYLENMLKNGMVYLSKAKDDGFYYQGNYSIDVYIKEIADEKAIAKAEAKYNTEKAKLNAKEETLDMKMKNLDTEISSLTTEYDTVKNTISKNIEKSFKRYNA